MFIFSLKADKNKLFALLLIVLLILGTIILCKSNGFEINQNSNDASIVSKNIQSNDDIIKFLAHFNWVVDESPVEVSDIIIPTDWGDVYNNYNSIQKSQGFDLSKYKGQKCKHYSYSVLNYPNITNDVRANILLLNDEVIGGDISLIRIDGFMHGFIDENAKKN